VIAMTVLFTAMSVATGRDALGVSLVAAAVVTGNCLLAGSTTCVMSNATVAPAAPISH
jgi:hypothetical protein